MQNKGPIKLFAIVLALICFYYMTFTYVTYTVREDASTFADEFIGSPSVVENTQKYSSGNAQMERFYKDSVSAKAVTYYLDSLMKKPVYNLFITSYTLEECLEREINKGLDLKGGMNVTLELSVSEILKGLSNNNPDEKFNKAIEMATEKQKTDNKDYVTLFGDAYKKINPTGKLAPLFQTLELKGKIDFNTPDDKVLELLRERVEESVQTAENTLRARIDKFGVTQPSIQKLSGSGRILVELPGVTDKERVRKLIQSTANLEFWETYENSEIYPMLEAANKRLAESNTMSDSTKMMKDSTGAVIASSDSSSAKTNSLLAVAKDDSTSLTSLAGAKTDSTGGKLSGAAADGDTSSLAKARKENPLFMLLRPALYQTEKGYMTSPGPVIGYVNVADTAKVNKIFNDKKIRNVFPNRMKFLWGFKPVKDSDGSIVELIAIKVTTRDGKSPLEGDIIADARKTDDYQGGGQGLTMTMKPEAAQIWKRLTADNIGKSISIVLDDKVYSYPTVQGEIPNGTSSITGQFSPKEANDLVNILRAGKLPAPARIVEETVVGPTLGEEAVKNGLMSFVIALLVVFLFMGFYYSKAGWVADIALFANVFFVMGVLASMSAVLTLPGIAGIVLTIGLSVDANILIFERIREELAEGKGQLVAIKEGFKNAMSSILDSNITLFILGAILYAFGTGPIQGFATTLMIGIITSLFSAIFITRIIFDNWLAKNKTITFSTKLTDNLFKNINIDFVGKRKLYYILSALIIATGAFFYVKNGGFNLGVDFKGGRSYVVRFDETQNTDKVKAALTKSFGTAPEVKTYGESTQQKITTTYLIEDNSDSAESKVEMKLIEGLNNLKVPYEKVSSQKVGETISRDIKISAIWAVLFSCLVMFLYIFIRFKKWTFGLGSVVALFHDVLIVLSFYTIFDGVLPFSLEIDQHFIAAILTVMGYTMTESVIVFDRIREYLSKSNRTDMQGKERTTIINYALNSTLSRTINTSLTILFVLIVIFIFGGETIRGFIFALLIGRVIGTYSSLCISTPIVIDFEREKEPAK